MLWCVIWFNREHISSKILHISSSLNLGLLDKSCVNYSCSGVSKKNKTIQSLEGVSDLLKIILKTLKMPHSLDYIFILKWNTDNSLKSYGFVFLPPPLSTMESTKDFGEIGDRTVYICRIYCQFRIYWVKMDNDIVCNL